MLAARFSLSLEGRGSGVRVKRPMSGRLRV